MWQFSRLERQEEGESEPLVNKLVFIGLNLDKPSLTASLKACLKNAV